jgi:hypothetical protein
VRGGQQLFAVAEDVGGGAPISGGEALLAVHRVGGIAGADTLVDVGGDAQQPDGGVIDQQGRVQVGVVGGGEIRSRRARSGSVSQPNPARSLAGCNGTS